ncbi:hypothetical protein [Ancylobacter sp.]|uniref:hypothetical protein n=1 Tax=Ancylobacter sp. TaxID=1872567 RepID=UPI003BAAEC86
MSFRRLGDTITKPNGESLGLDGAGSTRAVFDFAWEKMRKRLASRGAGEASVRAARNHAIIAIQLGLEICDSPIERTLLPALVCADFGVISDLPAKMHDPRRECLPDGPVVITPQFGFARSRMDFAVAVRYSGRLQMFCIECDGAAYHSSADNIVRDGYFASWGIPTTRVSGREIYADTFAAAQKALAPVHSWALHIG